MRSFDLGCCVPNDILMTSTFAMIQKGLRSISLITDGGCPTFSHGYLDLALFSNLQSLSWKGLCRGDHFDCLARLIKDNTVAQMLKTLELDLVDWPGEGSGWNAHQRATQGGFPYHSVNFFVQIILRLQRNQEYVLFQSLETCC